MRTRFILTSSSDPIAVTRRVHPRSKRLWLRVDVAGRVEVVSPAHVPDGVIDDFLADHLDWIERRLAAHAASRLRGPSPDPIRFENGATFPLFGRAVPLRVSATDRARVGVRWEGSLCVDVPARLAGEPLRSRQIRRGMEKWLKQQISPMIDDFVEEVSGSLGCRPRSVRLVSPRRRWGSCSADGSVRFNWRLVFANKEIIRYVVVHELCHLEHPHHGQEFWSRVAGICPDYSTHRRWLREHAYLIEVMREEKAQQ